MKEKNKKLLALACVLSMVLAFLAPLNVFAAHISQSEAMTNLESHIASGDYQSFSEDARHYDFAANTYKTSGGGFVLYAELTGENCQGRKWFDEKKYETLTAGEKQRFLKDMFAIANAMAYDTELGHGGHGVTTDTVNDMMTDLQSKSNLGASILASLLSETKPNYAKANKIYKPFSGIVGTILGIMAILIMSLLGITMALDIAYIVIPAVQLAIGTDEGGGKDGNKLSKIVSIEARNAVNVANTAGNNGGGGNGENKVALGEYFKARWKGLVILGICLLYLIQGQLWAFVAWFVDLMSGFLGF